MSNTKTVTTVFLWMLVAAVVVFVGGWALTTYVAGITWTMTTILIATVIVSVIAGLIAYAGTEGMGSAT